MSEPPAPLPGPFIAGDGLEWLIKVEEIAGAGDSGDDPFASDLVLLEDGAPLGPAHCGHAEIAKLGAGRFSHWGGWLRFSTSDGSDPNRAGRTYTLTRTGERIPVVGMGSCHLHAAVSSLAGRGLVRNLWGRGLSYSPREALQLLRWDARELEVEGAVADLAVWYAQRGTLGAAMAEANACLVEFSAGTDLVLDGRILIRSRVDEVVFGAFRPLGKAAHDLARRWYGAGLLGQRDGIRAEAASRLLELLPAVENPHPLLATLLTDLRALPLPETDLAEAVAELRARSLGARLVVLVSHNFYLPDGRAMSWEGDLPRRLAAACAAQGVPTLLSTDVVQSFAPALPLKDDLLHFEPELEARIGERLLALAT